jgi:acyl carrier protein
MREKIIALIEEVLMVPAGTITEDTVMEDVEEWDSLAHVMIIGELEEKLGISISLDETMGITSVKDIFDKAGV